MAHTVKTGVKKSPYKPPKGTVSAPKAPAAPTVPKPYVPPPEWAAMWGNAYAQLHPGWTPPAPVPGVNVHPGNPGVKTQPVAPFMTGPDIINFGDAFKSHSDQIAQADKDLADIKAWAQTAIHNIGQNYIKGVSATQDNAAARGLFQSSIKDGALADLAATKATLLSDTNTRVNNAQLFHDEAIKRVNDWWANFQEGMNSIKVGNAAEAGKNAPLYVPGQEPTATTFTVPTTIKPVVPPKPTQTYTGPKYSLGKPGKPKYRLGGYAQ